MKEIDNKYKELIWSASKETYEAEKNEFYEMWVTTRKIYIALLCAFIIPGIIWGWIFYKTKYAQQERSKSANSVMYKMLNKLDKVDSKIESVSTGGATQNSMDKVPLPLTKTQNLLATFDIFTGGNRNKIWKEWFDESNKTSPLIAQQLLTTDLMQEMSGRRDGAAGLAAKKINIGKLLKREAQITTNAVANVKLTSGAFIQIANAKLVVDETYRVKNPDTGDYKEDHKALTLWSGLVVNTKMKGIYPHPFKVISKDFSTSRDKAFPDKMNPIVYELESVEFTDGLDLLTTKEEPVKLRKQFSINNLGHFVDLQRFASPFAMSSNEFGVSFAFDAITQKRNDMPLYVEKPWKFFKNEEYAKEVLNQEFSILLHIIQSIAGLEDDKFFKQ